MAEKPIAIILKYWFTFSGFKSTCGLYLISEISTKVSQKWKCIMFPSK